MQLPDFSKVGNVQTRANALRWMEKYSFHPIRNNFRWLATVCIAFLISWLHPVQEALQNGDLSADGVWMLRITIIAAGLWLTEAIPAFATAMLVMALELLLITGSEVSAGWNWSELLSVWGSPLIWLFFGGFLLAEAFRSVELDQLATRFILKRSGNKYTQVTLALSALTFVLSMFMSNTATITVVVALLAPFLKSNDFPISKRGLLLALAVSANLGGMVTLVGTPPNAIAAVSMSEVGIQISFFKWMLIAAPFALVLFFLSFLYIRRCYFSKELDAFLEFSEESEGVLFTSSMAQRLFVCFILLVTVVMWLSQPLHGINPTITAFLAITALSMTGVLTSVSLKNIPWDILILMAGGLSLGKGISETGLASYLTGMFTDSLSVTAIGIIFAYLAIMMSNFMSNTAASNALLPLVVSATTYSDSMSPHVVLAATFACSCAILLPVSTPPNAICYSTGKMKQSDYARLGLLFILFVPPLAYYWTMFATKVFM